jgi:ubiquinone/menaquinone biosynthesis C-methylase UbiE
MRWNRESAVRYDKWAGTVRGSFALQQEKKLLQGVIAPWPRRKQKLLDIGCGTGMFLEFFWSCGFDLTGMDKSPDMLARAREKIGHRADLHLGSAEHLPFEDREFDYASLMTVFEFLEDPALALREAARVARKGLLICFLNRMSLYGLSVRLEKRKSPLGEARWFTWPEMRALIQQNLSPGGIEARSILLGPPCTWNSAPVIRYLNSTPAFPWMGAFTAVRVDLTAPRAQTPLMAWNTEPTT